MEQIVGTAVGFVADLIIGLILLTLLGIVLR
jgi:hypothetical protein